MKDPRPHLLHHALDVLDRYSGKLGNRDPVKSLNEDQDELLHRVRIALEPLISDGEVRRDEVADLAARIDAALATRSAGAQSVRRGAFRTRKAACSRE